MSQATQPTAQNPQEPLHTKPDKAFYRTLVVLTLPVALQNVVSYSVNLMDTLMLGSLGEVALSATSLANQMFFIYTVVIFGIAGGAIVLCSQYWGRGDVDAIRRVTSLTLKISAGLGVVFTALLLCAPQPIMRIFTTEQPVIDAGVSYLRIVAFSYLFYGITATLLVILRSVETVNISLVIYTVSFFVNVVFNYMFIFGKWGAPCLGVAGAAVGTVLARLAEFIMMLVFVLVFERKIRFRLRMLRWHSRGLAKDMLRYGAPVMMNEAFWSIAVSMHAVILGHMGSEVVAANSICNVIFQMMTSAILGVSNASAVLVGKVVGAGQFAAAKARVRRLVQIYFVCGIVCAALIFLVKDPIIGLYRIEDSTRALAQEMMLVYSFTLFFMAFTCPLITGVFRGSGDVRFAALCDVGCIWLMIPFGAAAAFWLGLPPWLVLLVLKCDLPLKTLLCLLRLRTNHWIRNITR